MPNQIMVQNKNSDWRQNSYQNHFFFCYKKPIYPEKLNVSQAFFFFKNHVTFNHILP